MNLSSSQAQLWALATKVACRLGNHLTSSHCFGQQKYQGLEVRTPCEPEPNPPNAVLSVQVCGSTYPPSHHSVQVQGSEKYLSEPD